MRPYAVVDEGCFETLTTVNDLKSDICPSPIATCLNITRSSPDARPCNESESSRTAHEGINCPLRILEAEGDAVRCNSPPIIFELWPTCPTN